MAANRAAVLAIPAAAALLLWPALWNGYPIVFADTGTYLSQAVHHYAGWDRPVFYSFFMLPLHATVTLWPVVMVQALLTALVLWLVCRMLAPGLSGLGFVGGVAVLSVCTWLPWMVSELMPDVFTPLLVLVLCMLVCVPERLAAWERIFLAGLAAFMIASQQSSVPLACVLLGVVAAVPQPIRAWHQSIDRGTRYWWRMSWPEASPSGCHGSARPGRLSLHRRGIGGPDEPNHDGEGSGCLHPTLMLTPRWCGPAITVEANASLFRQMPSQPIRLTQRWLLIVLPPALAILALCTINLAAHGRFSTSPFGAIFPLARVIYDGPGMATLRRDCPVTHWRLCPFLDSFPPTSDDFLWAPDSPLARAGGPKVVSRDAGAILWATVMADPMGEAAIALANTLDQLLRFVSGDGLNSWPVQVSPWIENDFPPRERAAYASARQQAGALSVPPILVRVHAVIALAGVIACIGLLPIALSRRTACAGFLIASLIALPVSAAITGGLSAPHDRYQSRIMWLPAFTAIVSLGSLRARRTQTPLPLDNVPARLRTR